MKFIVFCLILVPCLALPREIQTDKATVELPDGAISCQIDSPTRDECIKEAIQDMLPKLQKGIDYLNIPPIDPYTMNETTFEYKRGDIAATMNIKTVTFHGLSKSEIKDVRTQIDDIGMSTEIDVFMPRIFAEGLYKATGKVNSFKINAKGAFNVTFKDMAITHKMKGVFKTIDGERYLQVESYDLIPTIGDLKVKMTGIFPDPELTDGAISCQIDSPTRDQCIKEAIQDMLPKLRNGIAYLNIPPIDPHTVNGTTFEYRRGDISGRTTIKTITFHGLSKTEIRDVRTKIDENGMSTEFDVFMPRIYADGLYKATGKVGSLKINAKGAFNVTFKDMAITHKTKGVFQTIHGERYLRLQSFDAIPTVGDFKIKVTGLLPDPELNKLALEFINQYWPFLYRDIVPETQRMWEPIALEEINAFLLRLPFGKMMYYGDKKAVN